ncbi:MAG: hypothetical protein ACTIKR_12355 [Advenella sp.]|uniref:Uncharacterized protein n=1 Tax=Advenella kashmirensis TaxID=310575 RepID=A0A356LGB7_9BURK|nr:hypothetical protein [Advenella sp. FME57]HBP30063.1 hypothetical protein [Advenella kashmirensis]
MNFFQWANQQLTRSPNLYVGRYRKGPQYTMPSVQGDIFKFYLNSGGTVTVYESAFEADTFALDAAFLNLCEQNNSQHFKINDEGTSLDKLPNGGSRAISSSYRETHELG